MFAALWVAAEDLDSVQHTEPEPENFELRQASTAGFLTGSCSKVFQIPFRVPVHSISSLVI